LQDIESLEARKGVLLSKHAQAMEDMEPQNQQAFCGPAIQDLI
jgi:hypothetical protein